MNYTKIRKYYGSDYEAAHGLSVTVPTLRNWKAKEDCGEKIGYHMQLAIQSITKGGLKADK